jgi:hypothetical protein
LQVQCVKQAGDIVTNIFPAVTRLGLAGESMAAEVERVASMATLRERAHERRPDTGAVAIAVDHQDCSALTHAGAEVVQTEAVGFDELGLEGHSAESVAEVQVRR